MIMALIFIVIVGIGVGIALALLNNRSEPPDPKNDPPISLLTKRKILF
jgi:hypothetical protein